MRFTTLKWGTLASALVTMSAIILGPHYVRSQWLLGQQKPDSKVSTETGQAISAFEKRAKEYSELRERIERAMPKLAKESTPEQIQAHKTALGAKVKTARLDAKHGDIFTPAVAVIIRNTIKTEFMGTERLELRKTVLEADTKGVPLRVNNTYPATKELVEMPPTLLLKLPQLPKELRYRFVDRNMLLLDRENGLIVDYMIDALP
jgi:hypothetical protein